MLSLKYAVQLKRQVNQPNLRERYRFYDVFNQIKHADALYSNVCKDALRANWKIVHISAAGKMNMVDKKRKEIKIATSLQLHMINFISFYSMYCNITSYP